MCLDSSVNLLLLEASEVGDGGAVTLSGVRAHHLIEVLKVAPGHRVRVGVLDGGVGTGQVTEIDTGRVLLSCTFGEPPERPAVDLLLALPRPKVLRRLWAQLAALGVGRVILTNAARVERNYFDSHVVDPAHYRPLLVEGLQQARDTRLPQVSIHRQFRVLIEDELDGIAGTAHRLVADPGGTASVGARVAGRSSARVLLAVGPEGGWNRFELDLLHAHGFDDVGMGARTLRSDTAVIALLALVHDALPRR
jgi:RsmE family RNA methyltransferase